jgi:hypothetical protein
MNSRNSPSPARDPRAADPNRPIPYEATTTEAGHANWPAEGALGMFGIGSGALRRALNAALSERDEHLRQRDTALGERNSI